MRPRPSTRFSLLAFLTVALLSLSGCVWFANADREIAALREFALTLDGVTTVDEESNGPTYTANPFSIDATAVVLITIEGDDWQQSLPTVAHAVIDWLETEQTNELVTLGAGIRFPGGIIGLANTESTDARIETALAMSADSRITHVEIGWQPEASENADAYVEVERDPAALVSAIVTEWMPQLTEFGPLRVSVPAETDQAETNAAERTLLVESPPTPSNLSWIDAVDVMPGVIGWRADSDGATVSIDTDASLGEIEAALRGLDGFDEAGTLTLVQGELRIVSDGTTSAARELAETLAGDDRFTEIVPGTNDLSVVAQGEAAAADLVENANPAIILTLEIAGDRDITLRDVAVEEAQIWLPAFTSIATFDRITVWGGAPSELEIEFEGRFDAGTAFPAIDAIRTPAIELGTRVGIEFRETDYFFIARFDAQPQLNTVDAGRDVPLTDEHKALIAHWNNPA